jgi:hypothetical protein
VLPPISYPPVLAPCAGDININATIMATYLDDILPGEGGVEGGGFGWLQKRRGLGGPLAAKHSVVSWQEAAETRDALGNPVTPRPASPPPCLVRPAAAIAGDGDDGNYGSAATLDVLVLQALSTRIHYGKFVAEAKFRCGARGGGGRGGPRGGGGGGGGWAQAAGRQRGRCLRREP